MLLIYLVLAVLNTRWLERFFYFHCLFHIAGVYYIIKSALQAGVQEGFWMTYLLIGHFRVVLRLSFNRGLVHALSYENEFYLHVNENSFSYERLCTKTCFEEEVQGN